MLQQLQDKFLANDEEKSILEAKLSSFTETLQKAESLERSYGELQANYIALTEQHCTEKEKLCTEQVKLIDSLNQQHANAIAALNEVNNFFIYFKLI